MQISSVIIPPHKSSINVVRGVQVFEVPSIFDVLAVKGKAWMWESQEFRLNKDKKTTS